MDSRCCLVADRCVVGGNADVDVTSLLDETVTVGRGVCDAVTSRPAPLAPASVELVTFAVLTVTVDVRLSRSNISDDTLDELDVLASAGTEFTDRLNRLVFSLSACFACRRSHMSSNQHIPAAAYFNLTHYSALSNSTKTSNPAA